MGQYKSYRESFLDKQLAEIERELIAYKARQPYGTNQIIDRVSEIKVSSDKTYRPSTSTTGYYLLGTVTFTGTNVDKLARGSLVWTPSRSVDWYLAISGENTATNEIKWLVLLRTTAGAFDATFTAYTNMAGKLSYVSH